MSFTFTEECWQLLALLSVGGQDKSSVFINKIDGIAYHQFLFCVFPSRLYSAEHLLWLSSYPLCPSPGTLRCFNIFHTGYKNPHSSRYSTAPPSFIDTPESHIPQCLSVMANKTENETFLLHCNRQVFGRMKSIRNLITCAHSIIKTV